MAENQGQVQSITFEAWINPLVFQEVDEPWATTLKKKAGFEDLLRFICTPGLDPGLDRVIDRYREISRESKDLFAAPAEQRILNKIVWPLRHAKAGYILGNYLGTIALCGVVVEMLAILLFEVSNITLKEKPIEDSDQKKLFGSKFENLGQERRINVLRAFDVIGDDLQKRFDLVREIRKKYLHFYSQDEVDLPKDAIKVYDTTVSIAVDVIGQDIVNGGIRLRQGLLNYLNKHGLVKVEK